MNCERCKTWVDEETTYIHMCYDGLTLFVIEKYPNVSTNYILYLTPDKYLGARERLLERYEARQDQPFVRRATTRAKRKK